METKFLYLPKTDPLTLIMMGVDCACTFQTAIYPQRQGSEVQKNAPETTFRLFVQVNESNREASFVF